MSTPENPETPATEPTIPLPPTHHPYGSTPPPAPYGSVPPAPPAPGYPPAPPAYGAPQGYGAVPPQGYGAMQPRGYAPQPAASSLYVAAAIINWVMLGLIVVATCGIGVIAAAWFVPMTINMHKGARDPWKHTALAVCTLLFCNIVSGILMLCDEGNRQDRPLA